MTAGRGDLERVSQVRLAAQVGEVRRARGRIGPQPHGAGDGALSPAAKPGSSATLPSGTTSIPPANAASGPLSAGRITASAPPSRAASAIARAPLIART